MTLLSLEGFELATEVTNVCRRKGRQRETEAITLILRNLEGG
jgi:hypothetical protein